MAEGRNIPKVVFIEQFLSAKETVNRISHEFRKKVTVFLVKKDFEKNTVESIIKIRPDGQVDNHLAERYSREELEKCL